MNKKTSRKHKFGMAIGLTLLISPVIELVSRRFPGPSQEPSLYQSWSGQQSQSKTLALVGDTQRTSLPEVWLMGREQNDQQSRRVLKLLASHQPELLIMLGDMVFDASSKHDWAEFDSRMAPIRQAQLPVLPVLGNHEYWGPTSWAKASLRARFPSLESEQTWSSWTFGKLGLILLDSNHRELSSAQWQQQCAWFSKELDEWSSNPAIHGILVFTHHPPYTNSLWVNESQALQRDIVPAFVRNPKTLAMFSGHAHGYEHFLEQGRHFIVSGGGGGPRFARKPEKDRLHKDVFVGKDPRPFNYVLLRIEAKKLRCSVRGFRKGDNAEGKLEDFSIPLPSTK